MKSPFFLESEARALSLKYTVVPPAEEARIRYFRVKHHQVCVLRQDRKGRLLINRGAYRKYKASKRKRQLPITYELRWELACECIHTCICESVDTKY